ncbi:putative pentatricopeptide repeat-containing protein [Sesamum angolense]|uniref:Pentatricopeptide repeat-containing protein n=1 Tax=Sesamum angolense TaxID=2727404 RepID=A0AAE1WI21_9LAMI|nr:putative pentatricopeptide repeat-containing protein [Sesamum angolense]
MGKQLHCRIIRIRSSSVFDNVFVVNALIDMYSKSGNMISSMRLFERLQGKDIITWNSVITGFAQNGHGDASLSIFQKMIQENVRPNDVTFIGVLTACSHSGLESEALRFLDMMKKKFGLIPRSDHYAILVDLLGRKNRLKEALEVIERAPSGSDHIGMWGALLATCRVHGNLELAKRAAEALFELEPKNTGRYVMLSNIYATAGRWDDSHRIRRLIDNMDLKKAAGSSWIEVKNARRMFVAEDVFQSQVEDIQELLLNLVNQMKDVGYMHIEEPFYSEEWSALI